MKQQNIEKMLRLVGLSPRPLAEDLEKDRGDEWQVTSLIQGGRRLLAAPHAPGVLGCMV